MTEYEIASLAQEQIASLRDTVQAQATILIDTLSRPARSRSTVSIFPLPKIPAYASCSSTATACNSGSTWIAGSKD